MRPASATRSCPSCAPRGSSCSATTRPVTTSAALLQRTFIDKVFPVLTPLAVDPAHPFPYISGLSLNLAVVVRNPVTGTELFARVKVPHEPAPLPAGGSRAVRAARGRHRREPVDSSSPGWTSCSSTRSGSPATRTSRSRRTTPRTCSRPSSASCYRRRFGPPVRLEVESSIDPYVLELLIRELGISEEEVFSLPGPLDLTGLWTIVGLDREDLQEASSCPRPAHSSAEVETAAPPDVLEAMRDHDVLLHHPYDSLLHQRAALPRAGRRRPQGPGHQADAVPHLRRLPDRRRPDRRRRGGQAGPGPGGDQGPLRRAREHLLGPQAGAAGRARGLRPAWA